ncbi:MAG: amidase [Hyphomicrobiaceae bacterium]
MSGEDLCYLTATAARERFVARTLSPVELLDALIARSEAVEPKINAFGDRYFDEARAQAKAAEARYMGRGAAPRPLEGIPVALKDVARLKGKRTTQGSLTLKDTVETVSDPMVERLLDAGAIIHARTNVPEFCLSGVCRSRLYGTTRNPHNLDYGPGGSSGGSGASLAAGTSTLATGTDIGGSIRIPAAVCGLYGYKPPHGRNPEAFPANLDPFNHCGPLARSVADAALFQNIVSGAHPRDLDSLRDRVVVDPGLKSLKGKHIAYSFDLGYMQVDAEVRRNMQAMLDGLKAQGAQVEEVDLGWTGDVERLGLAWWNSLHFGRVTVWQADKNPELLCDYTLKFAEFVRKTTLDDTCRALEMVDRMYQTFGPMMERFDAFLCPMATIPGIKAEHDPYDPDFRINGVKVDGEYGWVASHQFNMLNKCPAMSAPSGIAANGMPTSVQIVGRTYDDQSVFTIAAAAEQVAPFRRPKGL